MPVRLVCLTLLSAMAASAQSDSLSLSQSAGSPGSITLNLSLKTGSGQQPAGVQWTLSYSSADFTGIQVIAGPSATAAAKTVTCAGTSAAYKCLVAGDNDNVIPDGVLAIVSLTVSPGTPDTSSFVQLENAMGASPAGTLIPISAVGIAVSITGTTAAISVSTQSLQFAYAIGGAAPPAQSIQITATGGGALGWAATWTAPWLSVKPSSGTTPSTITVSVTTATLTASTYTDTIQITAGGASGSQTAISVTLTVAEPMVFVPMVPCRVADTRNADGAFGGPAIAGGASRNFVIPESACGIPFSAGGYSLNVAVVPAHTLGYLTVWPAGQLQPTVTTMNSLDGRIKSNATIVPAGAGGAISVFVSDTTHVILDINGYFVPAGSAGALAFYPLAPCRIADTRNPAGPMGGPALVAQGTRAFPVRGSDCGVPAVAQAYSLNFAAVPKGPLGYLTAWPSGQAQPVVASLNDVTGTITANAVIATAGASGGINVFASDATDLVIDTNGYFAPPGPGGLSLYNVAPCRVLDTQQNGGLPFSGIMAVTVNGVCGVPPTAQAYLFNATVTPPGALGYISLWPEGKPQPMVATLNAVDGAVTSNMAIVPAANGSIDVYASNPTRLTLDILGYFAP